MKGNQLETLDVKNRALISILLIEGEKTHESFYVNRYFAGRLIYGERKEFTERAREEKQFQMPEAMEQDVRSTAARHAI